MNPRRCAVYLRISLDQTGEMLAIERQREDALKLAAAREWTVVSWYIDNSITASKANVTRPEYNRMVADYEAGAFDAIICYDLDRFTRQPRQLEDWIDAAEKRGLALVTLNGEADLQTDAGRLFARIKVAVAKSEVERKSARQRRAQRQRAELGRPAKGIRPTGYTLDGDIVDEEARIVRTIFDRFAAGDSVRGIATWLTSEGFETRRGGPWVPGSIKAILTNARYAGRSLYKGEDVGDGEWPALVGLDQFLAVQARFAVQARAPRARARKYLGSGVYLCECGETVWASSTVAGKPELFRYICRRRHYSRYGQPIDEYVTDLVRARLARPDLAMLLAGAGVERLAELALDRNMLAQRIATIESDYLTQLIDGRMYRAAMEMARAELADVQREETRIAASNGPLSVLGAPRPVLAYDEAPRGVQARVVGVLLNVTLHPSPRGGQRGFNPDSVGIEWVRHAEA